MKLLLLLSMSMECLIAFVVDEDGDTKKIELVENEMETNEMMRERLISS